MKRWCVCKMGNYEGDGALTPAVAKYTNSFRVIKKKGITWALCQFAIADLTPLGGDADIHVLPDATLDASWGSVPVNIRNNILTKLQAAGFTTTEIKTAWTIRQVLNYIGGQLNAAFLAEQGDVTDIEQ